LTGTPQYDGRRKHDRRRHRERTLWSPRLGDRTQDQAPERRHPREHHGVEPHDATAIRVVDEDLHPRVRRHGESNHADSSEELSGERHFDALARRHRGETKTKHDEPPDDAPPMLRR